MMLEFLINNIPLYSVHFTELKYLNYFKTNRLLKINKNPYLFTLNSHNQRTPLNFR